MTRGERAWVCLAITLGLLEGTVRLAWTARRRIFETRYYR